MIRPTAVKSTPTPGVTSMLASMSAKRVFPWARNPATIVALSIPAGSFEPMSPLNTCVVASPSSLGPSKPVPVAAAVRNSTRKSTRRWRSSRCNSRPAAAFALVAVPPGAPMRPNGPWPGPGPPPRAAAAGPPRIMLMRTPPAANRRSPGTQCTCAGVRRGCRYPQSSPRRGR